MRGLVITIAVIAARRLGQQADGVIVPQGADAHACHACKLAAFHLRSSVGSVGLGSSRVVPTDSKNQDVTYESKRPQMLHAQTCLNLCLSPCETVSIGDRYELRRLPRATLRFLSACSGIL